jgi:tetratricopeptide (TPR) repeat protein
MFPNEARYYRDWSGHSDLPYATFLQAKQFEKSIRYAIDQQTLDLIASQEQLSRAGISVISSNLRDGFLLVSEDIENVRRSILSSTDRLANILEWGFAGIISSLGRINDSLDELVRIAKTPSRTWAYEQFNEARGLYRNGHFDDALEAVQLAINGYGSNLGLRTEFRFHFLLGTIRLGDWLNDKKNTSTSVVDPKDAEAAFLAAARYAEADYKTDAAAAYACAGRAAMIQGQFVEAIEHTAKSLALIPKEPATMYQIARLYCISKQREKAVDALRDVFCLDARWAIRVASEPDLLAEPTVIARATQQAYKFYASQYETHLARFDAAIPRFLALSFDEFAMNELVPECASRLQSYRSSAITLRNTGKLLDCSNAALMMVAAQIEFDQHLRSFRQRYDDNVRETARTSDERYSASEVARENASNTTAIVAIVLLGAIWFYCLAGTFSTGARTPMGLVQVIYLIFGPGLVLKLFSLIGKTSEGAQKRYKMHQTQMTVIVRHLGAANDLRFRV